MPDPDAELLRKANEGDAKAAREFVSTHGSRLYGLAVALCGNRDDAEDIVQDTFIGALRGIDRFEGRSTVKTWLSRILSRQVARYHRSRKVRQTIPLDAVATSESDKLAVAPDGRGVARIDLATLLAGLSDEHREVIVLRELEGLSYREISEALGIAQGTVESRLHRARRKLAKQIGDEHE